MNFFGYLKLLRHPVNVLLAGNLNQLYQSRRVRDTRTLFKFQTRCDRDHKVLSLELFLTDYLNFILQMENIEDAPQFLL